MTVLPERLAIILPIREADARAWLRGDLEDEDLAARVEFDHPEAVYGARMPGRLAWRSAVVQTAFWMRRGARLYIARSGHPVMLAHYDRAGARRVFQGPVEDEQQWRLVIEAPHFAGYFKRQRHVTSQALCTETA